MLVSGGARAAITRGTAQLMASKAAAGTLEGPFTRRAVREAANTTIANRGASNAVSAGLGLGSYSAISSVASGAAGPLESIVGYALKTADFEANLAMTGLEASFHATTQRAMLDEMASVASTAEGWDFSDLHEVQNGFLGYSVRVKAAAERVRISAVNMWRKYGYMTHRQVTLSPGSIGVMSNFTYVRIEDPTIRARGITPESRAALSAAFSRGVNVWRDINNIGATDNSYTG